MPYAYKCARRYCGGGAEFDDLAQEAFLILCDLVEQHASGTYKSQDLPLFLWSRLRGRVRSAAERLRRQAAPCSLDAMRDTDFDISAPPQASAFELLDGLTDDEKRLAQELIWGDLQKEIALREGVSQQAVSARVQRLRQKIKKQLQSDE